MFDNVLHQSACALLKADIESSSLPGSILFSGPSCSGKLTCALELARVLSCSAPGGIRGDWNCACPSCLRHKALVSPNLLVVGPGNRTLEIEAAKSTLLSQNAGNTRHLEAARYLYIRAVRKLTVRFSPVLWEGDDKLSKFTPVLADIDESLEELSPGRILPDGDSLEKILTKIEKNCSKLEGSFLYDSLPVSQIRRFSAWAHLTSGSGKKVLIIENADLMADSSRNALLKILEEPPEGTMLILTTTNRGGMLATILSRVRTYTFFERSEAHQREVIDRVFHYDPSFSGGEVPGTVDLFLRNYLPVRPDVVQDFSARFYKEVVQGHVPDIPEIVSGCGGFSPRILYRIFLEGIVLAQRGLSASGGGAECSARILGLLRESLMSVTAFNQNPQAALEMLARDIMYVNYESGGVMRL